LNKALGVEQTSYPPFGAMIILELHEIGNQSNVKVFYINETESDQIGGKQMNFSFCPDPDDCSYNVFEQSISKYSVNWMTDCNIPESYPFFSVLQKYVTITDDSGNYNPPNSAHSLNSILFKAILSIILTYFVFN